MVSNLLGRQMEVKLHTGQEAKLGMFMLSTLTAWEKKLIAKNASGYIWLQP
jgi:hypothetical protein